MSCTEQRLVTLQMFVQIIKCDALVRRLVGQLLSNATELLRIQNVSASKDRAFFVAPYVWIKPTKIETHGICHIPVVTIKKWCTL